MRKAEVSAPVIVIGHSISAKGACSPDGLLYEYDYNIKLAALISSELTAQGIISHVIDKSGFDKQALKNMINTFAPPCVVELHNDAYNNLIRGSSALILNTNIKSKKLADVILKHVYLCLNRQGKEVRGIKTLTPADRGYNNLNGILCPALILESFFIDQKEDFKLGIDKKEDLAMAIAAGCLEFLKS